MIAMIDKAERRLARGRAHPFSARRACPQARDAPPRSRRSCAARSRCPARVEGAPRRFVLEHRANDGDPRILRAPRTSRASSRAATRRPSTSSTSSARASLCRRRAPTISPPSNRRQARGRGLRRQTTAPISSATTRASGRQDDARPEPARVLCARRRHVRGRPHRQTGANRRRRRRGDHRGHHQSRRHRRLRAAATRADLFDLEYWSLEQIKLTKNVEKPLTRQIAVVTGAASGLGLAIAEALRAEGAELALLDIAREPLEAAAKRLGALAVACDLTDPQAVDAAFAKIAERFGGVDIVASNAGAAFQGAMIDVSRRGSAKGVRAQSSGRITTSRARRCASCRRRARAAR